MASTLHHWNPEDGRFWAASGRRVATRNLWFSIPALTLACSVWMTWSVLVVHLPSAGFQYSTNQLFWLAALPALCGATLRLFYAFAVPLVGGRRFTTLATTSLLLPALGIGYAVQDPATPYEWMVALALLCGLGGANFASSMANIALLFPAAGRGRALDLNAGFGHLGVAIAQLVVPLAIGAATIGAVGHAPSPVPAPPWLQNAGFVWVPLIAASAVATWLGMNDLASARPGFAEQAVIFARKQNWLMCWLHLGTFGSFIGFSASLPLLLQHQFPQSAAVQLAWLGPLASALLRPVGTRLTDRFGGGRVTFWAFVAMGLASIAARISLPDPAASQAPLAAGDQPVFLAAFGILFAAAGLGNGSTFRMIPALFRLEHRRRAGPLPSTRIQAQAASEAGVEGSAALVFASAIGAYGGFFIPKAFGTSIAWTGSPATALQAFCVFYLSCIALTWWHYGRRHASTPC